MLAASVLKKLLLILRYPSFAPELGPYRVGAIRTRIPGSTACQIHYPADPKSKSKSKDKTPYWRPEAVEGLADYSRMSTDLVEFLSARKHPCLFNADPLPTKKFPVVIFSHGLGGCMEMYTQLCQQIASYGYWVVALEHEDASGCYAETKLGDPILYKRPDNSPYSRRKVLDFRHPFLQQRVQETTQAVQYILSVNYESNSSNKPSDPEVQKVYAAADAARGVSLLGHSFGGASMVLSAQKFLSKSTSSSAVIIKPNCLGVLDPWVFSLEDQALNNGIQSIPTLSVLSEAWLTNTETAQVDQLLENCESSALTSLYAPRSVHASVADSVSWLPAVALRKLGLRGKKEKRHETIESVAKACVQHMQKAAEGSSSIDEIGTLQPYNFNQKDRSQTKVLSTISAHKE